MHDLKDRPNDGSSDQDLIAPEFLAGPLDGEVVPLERRSDNRIYCEREYPWVFTSKEYGSYAYDRTTDGDFICVGTR